VSVWALLVAGGPDRVGLAREGEPGTNGNQNRFMMKSVVTSVATAADVEALVGLYVGFRDSLLRTTPTPAQFRESLQRLLADANARIFLAKIGPAPVGYAAQRYFISAWASGREAVIEDLYVMAEHRNRGVGRHLVEHAIRDAVQSACGSMSLDTNERNEASNALYRRLGFTCERARWKGGRQIRYDLKLGS
jgi:ribosomal protein S18 acetylase RimI-like enzyme